MITCRQQITTSRFFDRPAYLTGHGRSDAIYYGQRIRTSGNNRFDTVEMPDQARTLRRYQRRYHIMYDVIS
jgi:hypothetical protein